MERLKDETLKTIVEAYLLTGEMWGKSHETISRYEREARKRFPDWYKGLKTYHDLRSKYSEEELEKLVTADRKLPTATERIDTDGEEVTFAFLTDTHFGASCFDPAVWEACVHVIKEENPNFIIHTGDVTDGFNPKHADAIFDMTALGYGPQKKYAVELLSQLKEFPLYVISGNHDLWYSSAVNANIVEDIVETLNNRGMEAHYLGKDCGDLVLDPEGCCVKVRLWHGEDGSSYSTSYRVQKLIEAMNINDRPDLLLCGHTHKMLSIYDQGVYAVSGGAVCRQSKWMQMKRLPNHTGFYMVRLRFNERGIVSLSPTWYGFDR